MRLPLSGKMVENLKVNADEIGLSVPDFIVHLLANYVQGTLTTSMQGAGTDQRRGPGRPVTVLAEDIPLTIERNVGDGGFVGVTRNGKFWQARIGRETLGGKYSSAEVAALVRHHTQAGFRIGRGVVFHAAGLPVDTAIDLATKAGFGSMPSSDDPPVLLASERAAMVGNAAAIDVPTPPVKRGPGRPRKHKPLTSLFVDPIAIDKK